MKPVVSIIPCAIALILAGCSTSGDSGVRGTAVYGPTCPVQRVGGSSCERPYSGEIDFEQNDFPVATAHSDGKGAFRVALPPGTYTVANSGFGLPTIRPFEVVVRPHAYTTVTVMFDSGIR